jgi:hypothetical protein
MKFALRPAIPAFWDPRKIDDARYDTPPGHQVERAMLRLRTNGMVYASTTRRITDQRTRCLAVNGTLRRSACQDAAVKTASNERCPP